MLAWIIRRATKSSLPFARWLSDVLAEHVQRFEDREADDDSLSGDGLAAQEHPFTVMGFIPGWAQNPFLGWYTCATPEEAARQAEQEILASHLPRLQKGLIFNGHLKSHGSTEH